MYWARSSASAIRMNPAHKPACHQPPRLIARPINSAATATNTAMKKSKPRTPPISQRTRVMAWTGPSEPIGPKPRDQPSAHNNTHPRTIAPSSATHDTHRSTLDGGGVDDSLISNCARRAPDRRRVEHHRGEVGTAAGTEGVGPDEQQQRNDRSVYARPSLRSHPVRRGQRWRRGNRPDPAAYRMKCWM